MNPVVNRFETLVELTLSVWKSAIIRRWPWATIVLVTVNLVLFVLLSQMDRVREQRLAVRGLTALAYFQEHPYLSLKAPLDEFSEPTERVDPPERNPTPSLANVGNLSASTQTKNGSAPVDHALVRRQQAELDGKVNAFAQVAAEWNTASLGYVPHARNGWGIITYQFIHGSWLHVLGNLFFLWLIGSKLERTWGSIPFAVCYLSSGMAAAGTHQVLAWNSAVPLIGASGAIAGVLGAFALRSACTGVRLTLPRSLQWRAWRVRAPLLIVVWFALELARALLLAHSEGSVSHSAHVGGFAFGVAFAWVLRAGRFEMRHDYGTPWASD